MDIIVTVPKSELKNILKERVWAEKEGAKAQKYWRVSKKCTDTIPKNLQPGDRVYFVEDGKITCWQEFVQRDYYFDDEEHPDSFYCEVTDREWGPGTYLVLKHPVHALKQTVSMRGFQGYRYTNRIE